MATDGFDSDPGSFGAPWQTLSVAIGRLATGDTLYIRGGTYYSAIQENQFTATGTSWSAPITIAAYGGETVIVPINAGGGYVVRFTDASVSYVELSGLILEGTGGAWNSTIVSTNPGSHHIRLRNCTLRNCQGGGALIAGTFHEFLDCTVHSNGWYPDYSPGSNGIYGTGSNCLVDGGLYYNNEGYAVRWYDSQAGSPGVPATYSNDNIVRNIVAHTNGYGKGLDGTSVIDGGGVVFNDYDNLAANCIFYNNFYGALAFAGTKVVHRAKFYNCTITGNVVGIGIFAGADTCEIQNCIVYGNSSDVQDSSPSTIRVTNLDDGRDPRFTNAAAHDYTLLAGSPATGTGTTLAAVPADFNDVTRTVPYSMGVYQPASGVGSASVSPSASVSRSASRSLSPSASVSRSPSRSASPSASVSPSVSPSVGGAVRYVATTGNNAGAGTFADPWQEIAYGVAHLAAGETLYIRGGTYTGSANTIDSQTYTVPSGTAWDNAVTIAGYAAEAVTIQPPYNVSAVRLTTSDPSYLIVQDVIIDMSLSTVGTTAEGIFIDTGSHHVRFQRVDVGYAPRFGVVTAHAPFVEFIDGSVHHTGTAPGFATEGHAFYINSSDNLLARNHVYSNRGYAFHLYNNAGAHDDPSRCVVAGNRVHGNGTNGTGAVIVVAWGDANQVINNLVYSNSGGIHAYTGATSALIANNTVYQNTGDGIWLQYYASAPTVRNNLSWLNGGQNFIDYGGTGTAVVDHNQYTDPSFTDASAGDFTLLASSDAIGAGTTVAQVTDDFDGTARTVPYTIGAYQGSAAALGTLTAADFTYLGAYAVPQGTTLGSETFYGTGLALRYEPSDGTNQVHLLSAAFANPAGGGAGVSCDVYEWRDRTPVIPGSNPTLIGSYPEAVLVADYGDLYSGKRTITYNGEVGVLVNWLDGFQGLYWDDVDARLYWAYGFGYSGNGTGEVTSNHFGYSVLNYGAQTGAGHGPWRLSNQSWKALMGGLVGIPASFAAANLGSSARRLGMGFGGYFSLVGSADASLGANVTAFTPPVDGATEDAALTGVPLVGYWPTVSAPATGYGRMTRPAYVMNSVAPDLWPNTKSWWLDKITGGVWIHGATKSGVVAFSALGMGQGNYIESGISSEHYRHYMLIYGEDQLASVAQATAARYAIQPDAVELQFGTIDYTQDAYTGGTPITIATVTSNASDYISGTHHSAGASTGALVTTTTPHGFSANQGVSIRGTSADTSYGQIWVVDAVVSSTSFRIRNANADNDHWSGASATGGACRQSAGGSIRDPIMGAAYDPATEKLYVLVAKLEGTNGLGSHPMVHVFAVAASA